MTGVLAEGTAGLTALVGQRLGPSSWVEVTQDRVGGFAEATGGPYEPGFLVLSFVPVALTEILQVTGFSLVVNYGCDEVRFPRAVPAGGRVRAYATVDGIREIAGGVEARVALTFEAEAAAEPACVAAVLIRYYA